MVGIQYQIGKDDTLKLLESLVGLVEQEHIKLMDIEIKANQLVEADFECYECGYKTTNTIFTGDDISTYCDECYSKTDEFRRMNLVNIKEFDGKRVK